MITKPECKKGRALPSKANAPAFEILNQKLWVDVSAVCRAIAADLFSALVLDADEPLTHERTVGFALYIDFNGSVWTVVGNF